MTYTKWVKLYKGTKIDYDNAYGVQCVDLIKHYIKKVLGTTPQSIGNAYQYWEKRNSKYISNLFVPVKNNKYTIPKTGDVFVRSSGYNSKGERTGHIGVCTGNGNTEYFFAYEQNAGGTGEGMTLHRHTNWSSINFLRPRYQYITAKSGLHGYSKRKGNKHNILIPYASKIQIIETECYRKEVNHKTYTFDRCMYKGKKYYIANEYYNIEV